MTGLRDVRAAGCVSVPRRRGARRGAARPNRRSQPDAREARPRPGSPDMAATQERTSTVAGGEDDVGAPERVSQREMRRARALRRLVLLLLLAFLVLGALNFFGGRMGKTQAQA